MGMSVERVEVWAANMKDEVGSLNELLGGLSDAGANFDFVIARRSPDKPGEGVLFVTPLEGDAEKAAAEGLGFNLTSSIHTIRIEGDDKAGAGAEITGKLAEAGVNMRGFSAAVIGSKFIAYIGLDTEEEANKAVAALQ
jgi:hypothetical protein